MESLKNFNDLGTYRESDEKYEDIENSIHNSLLYNQPQNRYNCHEFCFINDCFWIVPFGITLFMIIIVMVITVILVKKLS